MDKVEIYEWLKAQKYQTEYEYTGEYRMYFEVDMPKILEAYYDYKVKKLNKPAVSKCEGVERRALLIDFERWKTINQKRYDLSQDMIDKYLEYLKSINNC